MIRHLFTLASAVSMVLLVLTVALWVASWRRHGGPGFGHEIELTDRAANPHWSAMSRAGVLVVTAFAGDGGMSGGEVDPIVVPGFKYEGFRGPGGSFLFFTSTHRAIAAAFGILPVVWTYRRWRRKRSGTARGFAVHQLGSGERAG